MSMCSTDVQVSTQSSEKQLQKDFSADVSVSASYSGVVYSASFTASYSYKNTKNTYSKNTMSTGEGLAKCALYKASLK